MTDLDDEARERAERIREHRRQRDDPDGRVERVGLADLEPGEDLPSPGSGDGAATGQLDEEDLPEATRADLERVREKVAQAAAEEPGDAEVDEHFWALVGYVGVEQLKKMWLPEVAEALAVVDGRQPPE